MGDDINFIPELGTSITIFLIDISVAAIPFKNIYEFWDILFGNFV